jgi:hypothetical protein
VHLVFDIFQGIGVAAAVGIRPFLPALVVGALGAAHAQINFAHSHFAFLQKPPFLLGMVVGTVLLALADRRLGSERGEGRGYAVVLGVLGVVLGAILFGAALCRGGYATWPGLIGGIVCAVIGAAATRPLFARVRARLDKSAAAALPLYAEAAGIALAALSVLAPPVGPIGLAVLLWLLWSGRRRDQEKYAGLRILR